MLNNEFNPVSTHQNPESPERIALRAFFVYGPGDPAAVRPAMTAARWACCWRDPVQYIGQ
jgi:hypothetical protein